MSTVANRVNDRIVSSEDESLIVVDSNDNVLGHQSKAACHDGEGILHRAFSIFLFTREGNVLLQQRSPQKRLWPGFWANSCCSHPRRGEADAAAADRRVAEELGLQPALTFLYKFEYHARYDANGSENELCSVYAGLCDATPVVNPNEIAATRCLSPVELDRAMAEDADNYTPWLKLEWPQIRARHWATIERRQRVESPAWVAGKPAQLPPPSR